jgi:ribonuclease-3
VSPLNRANRLIQREEVEALVGLGDTPHDTGRVGDLALYRAALTHRSYVQHGSRVYTQYHPTHQQDPQVVPLQPTSYERLEFLGDAVLYLVTADYLCRRYPDQDEGFLSRMRTKLVNGRMGAQLCRRTGVLQGFVLLSAQAEAAGGREDPAVLEDVFEAFLGALFEDRGFQAASAWLTRFLEANLDFAELVASQDCWKDALTKHYQRRAGRPPVFEDLRCDHLATNKPAAAGGFTVCVRDPTSRAVVGTGTADTRKAAEKKAAQAALAYLGLAGAGGRQRAVP